MKKILLASTILVGTAGFAAADSANFTFSGKASVGFAYNMTTSFGAPTISAEFTAGMMTVTSGGLEAGAEVTVTAGGVSFEDDNTAAAFGTFSMNASSISDASAYVSGDWGKIAFSYDAGTPSGDITYTNTWGDFGIEATYTYVPGAGNDSASVEGSYSFGDYSVYAGVDASESPTWGVDAINFGGSATMSGFSLAVDGTYNLGPADFDWKATAGYSMSAYSFEVFVEDDGVDNAIDYGASAGYDLGGGVSINAGYVHDADTAQDVLTAGVSMKF